MLNFAKGRDIKHVLFNSEFSWINSMFSTLKYSMYIWYTFLWMYFAKIRGDRVRKNVRKLFFFNPLNGSRCLCISTYFFQITYSKWISLRITEDALCFRIYEKRKKNYEISHLCIGSMEQNKTSKIISWCKQVFFDDFQLKVTQSIKVTLVVISLKQRRYFWQPDIIRLPYLHL